MEVARRGRWWEEMGCGEGGGGREVGSWYGGVGWRGVGEVGMWGALTWCD
jgi:hypothetical protein